MTEFLFLGELSILYFIGMAGTRTIETKQKIMWCNTFGLLFSCTPQDWILGQRHLVGLVIPDQEYRHVIAGTDQKQSQEQGTERALAAFDLCNGLKEWTGNRGGL